VERSAKTHDPIVGKNQTRTRGTCRSQPLHRARNVPVWAVVIAETELASHADELGRFLGEAYPDVPLISVGQRARRQATTSINVDEVPDLALQIGNIVGMREQLGGMA
jgi:hypothetical protein